MTSPRACALRLREAEEGEDAQEPTWEGRYGEGVELAARALSSALDRLSFRG